MMDTDRPERGWGRHNGNMGKKRDKDSMICSSESRLRAKRACGGGTLNFLIGLLGIKVYFLHS